MEENKDIAKYSDMVISAWLDELIEEGVSINKLPQVYIRTLKQVLDYQYVEEDLHNS